MTRYVSSRKARVLFASKIIANHRTTAHIIIVSIGYIIILYRGIKIKERTPTRIYYYIT